MEISNFDIRKNLLGYDDVMNLQFSEIFDYLSIQAVKEASTLDLAAFQEFISK